MAGATRILTPNKVRQLQIALYRKAQAEPASGEVAGGPTKEFGEPNTGNLSVRFDEGRERVGHWRQSPFNPTSPAYSTGSGQIRVVIDPNSSVVQGSPGCERCWALVRDSSPRLLPWLGFL